MAAAEAGEDGGRQGDAAQPAVAWDGVPAIGDGSGPRSDVAFRSEDTTLNALLTPGGILTSLNQRGFQHLLAGARANIGLKSGRYMFEVVELCEARAKEGGGRPLWRIGIATAGAPLTLGDSADCVAYDSHGCWQHGDTKRSVAKPFERGRVFAVELNLASGADANTTSLFCDGERACEPQPLPEALLGRPLFPAVAFRGVTLRVNLGPVPIRPLPFACRTARQAATDDSVVLQAQLSERREVVFVVGLPNQGVPRWVDRFRQQHPGHVELSASAVREWSRRSGVQSDPKRPERFERDEAGLPAVMAGLSAAVARDFVVADVCGNLCAGSREASLARFGPWFRRVAVVVMGEPEEHRASARAPQGAPQGLASEPEACPEDLEALSLPAVSEGFDEVRFEWQPQESCEKLLREYRLQCKAAQRVEDIQPSAWSASKLAEWHKALQEWKGKQKEWKQVLEQLSEWKKEGAKDDEVGKEGSERPTDVDPDELDVFGVQDINDIGSGEPLYASFANEDWALLERRFELHLLVHAFRRDLNDPERPMFLERHLAFYYSRYFKKSLDLEQFGCGANGELLGLLRDTLAVTGSGMLEPQVSEDSPMDHFVRLAEEHRRDRQRSLDAGDETAALRFRAREPLARRPRDGRGPERPGREGQGSQPKRPWAEREAPWGKRQALEARKRG